MNAFILFFFFVTGPNSNTINVNTSEFNTRYACEAAGITNQVNYPFTSNYICMPKDMDVAGFNSFMEDLQKFQEEKAKQQQEIQPNATYKDGDPTKGSF